MVIIAFAILWGVQCMMKKFKLNFQKSNILSFYLDQDIVQLPLIVVILGSVASILFLIDILIIVSNRAHGKLR